jgi:hypothetical protein
MGAGPAKQRSVIIQQDVLAGPVAEVAAEERAAVVGMGAHGGLQVSRGPAGAEAAWE